MRFIIYISGEDYKQSVIVERGEEYTYFHKSLKSLQKLNINPTARQYYSFKELKVLKRL